MCVSPPAPLPSSFLLQLTCSQALSLDVNNITHRPKLIKISAPNCTWHVFRWKPPSYISPERHSFPSTDGDTQHSSRQLRVYPFSYFFHKEQKRRGWKHRAPTGCEFTLSFTFFTKSKREEVGNRFDSELDYNLDEESLPTSALVGLKFHNLQLSAYMHSCRDDGILLLHDQSENLFH